MSIRYFSFWCENCPTRIHLETEVPSGAPEGQPEYVFAESDWVGLARARDSVPGDDGLIRADLCPACAGPLHDVDDLVAREYLPMKGWTREEESALHAKVREVFRQPKKPQPSVGEILADFERRIQNRKI